MKAIIIPPSREVRQHVRLALGRRRLTPAQRADRVRWKDIQTKIEQISPGKSGYKLAVLGRKYSSL
jgi:hypothetical protein